MSDKFLVLSCQLEAVNSLCEAVTKLPKSFDHKIKIPNTVQDLTNYFSKQKSPKHMLICYDYLWLIVFLSHSGALPVNECGQAQIDTTLNQDCGTENDCVNMYTVQCRDIVDNKCELQLSSSHDDCTFGARLVSKTRKDQQAIMSLRFCQDDIRSTTQVEKRKIRSHFAMCGSPVTLLFNQSSASTLPTHLVQPIQCVPMLVHRHN